jgi:ankyrin repeat protein
MAGMAALEKMRESKIIKTLRRICFRKLEPEKPAIVAKTQDELDQALFNAAYHGETMKIEQLLNAGADIEARSKSSIMTPLMWAAREGRTETCALLLEKGADINATDNYNRTALIYTAIWGRIEACKFLAGRGADINIEESQNQRTARMVAGHVGRNQVMAYLGRIERLQNLFGKEPVPTFLSAFDMCISS